jgi:hypothetical protein
VLAAPMRVGIVQSGDLDPAKLVDDAPIANEGGQGSASAAVLAGSGPPLSRVVTSFASLASGGFLGAVGSRSLRCPPRAGLDKLLFLCRAIPPAPFAGAMRCDDLFPSRCG